MKFTKYKSDYVNSWCIEGDVNCSLNNKCDKCLKEIENINDADKVIGKALIQATTEYAFSKIKQTH
jgi:hypothetical protein